MCGWAVREAARAVIAYQLTAHPHSQLLQPRWAFWKASFREEQATRKLECAMTPDKMQSSRFELKYVIDEATALRMRDFVRCYLDPDEYARKRPDFSYPVHSIYLDSDEIYT